MEAYYNEDESTNIAQKLLAIIEPFDRQATVVGLSGDLGAGKTSLVKAIAKELRVSETVVSPTFVIAKFYEVSDTRWVNLVHIDAYRIEEVSELDPLGWRDILRNPKNLVIIEWPEKIYSKIPEDAYMFTISHLQEGRHIKRDEK